MTIRVMLVDDHEMVRQGLALMLKAFQDFELVGEAVNGREAVRVCAEVKPDVILMDLFMPEMDGIQAIRQIKRNDPDVQILALTSFSEQERIAEALRAGARGYLLKNTGIEQLATAIRAASQGEATLSPEATQALISIATQPQIGQNLTSREKDVLALMVEGLSNPQIAVRLNVERSTVKSHVSNLLQKLGVASRTEAVSLALKYHLVKNDLPPPGGG